MEYKDMLPHQQRVADERTELICKLGKLGEFIACNPLFEKLNQSEQSRLVRQYNIMDQYVDVLDERIAAFGTE